LHKGRTQTGPEAALDGGFTDYTEDLKRKEKYNMTLNFYKKNPTKIKEKAIGSFSTVGDDELDAAATCAISGDRTTWRWTSDERRDKAGDDPPIWHTGQEEEEAKVHDAPKHGVAPLA
jgi:hypothetical protein